MVVEFERDTQPVHDLLDYLTNIMICRDIKDHKLEDLIAEANKAVNYIDEFHL
jgi:hypothetical protein